MARITSNAALGGAALLLLASCLAPAHLPPDDGTTRAPTPGLLPLAEVLERVGPGVHTARATQDDSARVQALDARAQALRRPVLDAAQRLRLLEMLARHR